MDASPGRDLDAVVATLRPAGPVAERIADLWWFLFAAGVAVCVLVLALLVGALLRRRAEDASPARWIIGGGVIMPTLVLTVVFAVSIGAMRGTPDAAGGDPTVIEVIGHQWWWEVRYPSAGFTTANEIHIPVGSPVEVRLSSGDVIHSFWVPELAGKMDAMPDGETVLVLEAARPGEYPGRCAEFCGLAHAHMGMVVVAEPSAVHDDWLSRQQEGVEPPSTGLPAVGARVFEESGCGECHTVRGTSAAGTTGPDLTHVGSRQTLAAGTFGNGTAELERWITDPHAVKEGVRMPATELAASDLDAVVAYLENLE